MTNQDTNFPVVTEGRVGEAEVQTVDARELHAFLQVGKDFSTWIKDRIEQYDFVQGRDFEVFTETGENPSGGRPAKEYAITLDMAKELSMVERNEKGKQARAYFIACERKARQGVTAEDLLANPPQLLAIAQGYALQIVEMKREMAAMQSDVDALDRIAKSDGSLCITDAAKTLHVQPKALFAFLRSHRWIYTRAGASQEVSYQDKLASGLLEHKTTTVHRSDGSEKTVSQVRVTPKGLARLAQEFPPVAKVA